jgi:hypothetical protein
VGLGIDSANCHTTQGFEPDSISSNQESSQSRRAPAPPGARSPSDD